MGLFDKFKDKASEHGDKVNEGLAKAGDFASEKTGGKYDDKIERGKDAVGGYLGTDETAADETAADTAADTGSDTGAADEGSDGSTDRNA